MSNFLFAYAYSKLIEKSELNNIAKQASLAPPPWMLPNRFSSATRSNKNDTEMPPTYCGRISMWGSGTAIMLVYWSKIECKLRQLEWCTWERAAARWDEHSSHNVANVGQQRAWNPLPAMPLLSFLLSGRRLPRRGVLSFVSWLSAKSCDCH